MNQKKAKIKMYKKTEIQKRTDFVQNLIDIMRSNLNRPASFQKRKLDRAIFLFTLENTLSPPLSVVNYGTHVYIRNLEYTLNPTPAEIRKFAKQADLDIDDDSESESGEKPKCRNHINQSDEITKSCAECLDLAYADMQRIFDRHYERRNLFKIRRSKAQLEAEAQLMDEF